MITIYAEKPDMGTKIAAALDGITLGDGKKVSFEELQKYEKEIKTLRSKNGYFKIKYFGKDAYVTWGYGHLCELKHAQDYNPEYKNWKNLPLPYIPEKYELKLRDDAKTQYNIVKKCFKESDLIVCATDNDREGDLIFYNIYSYMNCKVPFKRAIFNKQSKEEYLKAFHPKALIPAEERQPVIMAGRARSAGDFVAGAGTTAALTLKGGGGDVLSVGRVQTATLALIVKREEEILNFKPENYFVIKGHFTKGEDAYDGIHERIYNKELAKKTFYKLKNGSGKGRISEYKTETFIKKRPRLYNLDTLQMDANKKYGFSLNRTLDIAQELYEEGFLSYPRTDSQFLPEDMGDEIENLLEKLFAIDKYKEFAHDYTLDKHDKYYFDNSKVESHYAIVPSEAANPDMKTDKGKIYDLVAKSVLCMSYPDAQLLKTKITTVSEDEKFQTNGSAIKDPGFMVVTGIPKDTILPLLKKGDDTGASFTVEKKQTEPPKRYTAATLLTAMINCGKEIEDEELREVMANHGKPLGIGRPSSRASIVSSLEKRNYIETQKKTIFPTRTGMNLIKFLPVEDLKSAEMTARWEKRLDDIERGTDTYESFMRDLENSVIKWTLEIQNMEDKISEGRKKQKSETKYNCPCCGKVLFDAGWGFQCDCGFKASRKIAQKKLSESQIKKLLTTGKTDMISGFISSKGKKFSAILVVEDGKIVFKFNDQTDIECPRCSKPLTKYSWGYKCSCGFSIGTICGKKLTETQVKKLIDGDTVFIKGMTSKKGKEFDANLYLDAEGAVKFSFY